MQLRLVGPHVLIALALAGEMAWVRSCRAVRAGEGLFGSASPSFLLHFSAVVPFSLKKLMCAVRNALSACVPAVRSAVLVSKYGSAFMPDIRAPEIRPHSLFDSCVLSVVRQRSAGGSRAYRVCHAHVAWPGLAWTGSGSPGALGLAEVQHTLFWISKRWM